MDAWETLISNSSLQSGDAFEHLHSQEGGEGGTTIVDSYEITVEQSAISVVLSRVEATVTPKR